MKCFSEIQISIVIVFSALFFCSIGILILMMKRFSDRRFSILSTIGKNEATNGVKIHPKRILFVVKDVSHLLKYFGPSFLSCVKHFDDVFVLSIQPCKGPAYFWHKKCSEVLFEYLGLNSANLLFVWEERLSTLNDIPWDVKILLKIILFHVRVLDITEVITYDQEGINEDIGCLAINDAILYMSQKNFLAIGCRVFVLQSVSSIRSLSGLFDLPLSLLVGAPRLVVCTTTNYIVLQKFYLMYFKGFQNWLKLFYTLITNRYFLFNNFVPIEDEIDCDI